MCDICSWYTRKLETETIFWLRMEAAGAQNVNW
jgi:hypothetical protein